jgi:hypothetical protein
MKKNLKVKETKKIRLLKKRKFWKEFLFYFLGTCLQEVSRSFVEEYVGM